MKEIRKSIRRLARHAEESSETGYPDRLLLMPGGRMAWVEVKSKGEKPRVIQEVRMARLRRMGFRVYVADSREKVDEIVRAAAEPLNTEKGEDDGVQTV